MVKIQTLPCSFEVTEVAYSPTASAVCVIRKVPFQGTLNISYVPNGFLLEFESFEAWLESISLTETTIEGLAYKVFEKLQAVLGDIPLRVLFEATTAVHAPVCVTLIQPGGESQ